MTPAEEVLRAAQHKYSLATQAWFAQRDVGGIQKLDRSIPEDSDEIAKGRKYKTTTPTAAMVMGVWQKCKADLDHAAANVQRERGDTRCPTCKDDKEPMTIPPAEDTRLVGDAR